MCFNFNGLDKETDLLEIKKLVSTLNNYELINILKESNLEIILERTEKSGNCETKIACLKSNNYIFDLSYTKLNETVFNIKREIKKLN